MAQMRASLQKLKALPGDTQFYCAHEYTLSNLAFAIAVEPDNADLQARIVAAKATRAANRPTVPSTIALEQQTNPFLRWDAPQVIACAKARANQAALNSDEVFAQVREWKNSF